MEKEEKEKEEEGTEEDKAFMDNDGDKGPINLEAAMNAAPQVRQQPVALSFWFAHLAEPLSCGWRACSRCCCRRARTRRQRQRLRPTARRRRSDGWPCCRFRADGARQRRCRDTHDLAGVVLLSCADEACNAFDNNQSPTAASG